MSTHKGSCLCQAVQYEITLPGKGEQQLYSVCHCKNCQKGGGSPFTANFLLPAKNMKLTKGVEGTDIESYPMTQTTIGTPMVRYFCFTCGSTLYGKSSANDAVVIIQSGSLDDPIDADVQPTQEIFSMDSREWLKPLEGTRQVKKWFEFYRPAGCHGIPSFHRELEEHDQMEEGVIAAEDELNVTIRRVFEAPEPQLTSNLTNFFEQARVLPVDHNHVLYTLTVLMKIVPATQIATENPAADPLGCCSEWPSSVEASVRTGMIETMVAIISAPWDEEVHTDLLKLVKGYMAKAHAWQILINVSGSGNIQERRTALDKQLGAGIIQLCLTTLYHRVLLLSRSVSQLLCQLSSESFLPEMLSPRDAGIVISSLCTFALQDSDGYADQLIDPTKKWQWSPSGLNVDDPWAKNDESRRLMAKRLFGDAQVLALDSVRGLLCLDRSWSPRRFLEIIDQTPTLLDLLMDCTILELPSALPSNGTVLAGPCHNTIACEALCALFRWPLDTIPGVMTSPDRSFGGGDTRTLIQLLRSFTSQAKWADRLIDTWISSGSWCEDSEEFKCSFAAAESLYSDTQSPFSKEIIEDFFEGSGRSRISLLRLITTLTHFADAAGVKNVDIYSLLGVAYQASLKISRELNRTQSICDWPAWLTSVTDSSSYCDPFHVAPERVLGPTAFARLLVVLAQRNALNSIQLLQKSPDGLSPTTSLAQIQQMTHPDIIRRFLHISVYRIKGYMEEAMFGQQGPPHSSVIFYGAAELAAAIVAFVNLTGDVHTQVTYRARYTLVAALGNLSKVALQMKQYKRAYSWALAAIDLDKKSDTVDKVDADLVKAYHRLARDAKKALDLHTNSGTGCANLHPGFYAKLYVKVTAMLVYISCMSEGITGTSETVDGGSPRDEVDEKHGRSTAWSVYSMVGLQHGRGVLATETSIHFSIVHIVLENGHSLGDGSSEQSINYLHPTASRDRRFNYHVHNNKTHIGDEEPSNSNQSALLVVPIWLPGALCCVYCNISTDVLMVAP
ncbi:hypothetical protein CONPUDRAFT_147234 [Coniophora puteana RWD-64-598 SS2]|uniref:CENP-V/GFA domain-containing protein n=1 Tax=Coniophora puteana (strain RWD-64-598) TaxID=741705 RepID=A0A5M3M9D1_CONPW|nr:uncharacterized protein CONPUDRAFT_147234 [Coniophora puteana RWD-64-598 SS2]EIW75713.1 hypothetical protein CONPUDRAFT_147234 [Coniophora puteana RWD-64-598 SS2]